MQIIEVAPPASSVTGMSPARVAQTAALVAVVVALVGFGSPPLALLAGFVFTTTIGHPFAAWNRTATKWLLQVSVVLLGFGMNLSQVLRLGLNGSLFAAVSIAAVLLLGRWLGRVLRLDRRTGILISVGTAICGGSAIAAVSSVIAATEAEIAVSIGAIFVLNAVALYVFPLTGHLLHLSQSQFGLWAGVAIQDISSVVGAGISYGPGALATATAVKLSRTLWIIPVTLAIGYRFGRTTGEAPRGHRPRPKVTIPWFIGAFLLASLLRSFVPQVAVWSPAISDVARRGTIIVLFLIGTSLSIQAMRAVGWRTLALGVTLWVVVSAGSLAAITLLHLGA